MIKRYLNKLERLRRSFKERVKRDSEGASNVRSLFSSCECMRDDRLAASDLTSGSSSTYSPLLSHAGSLMTMTLSRPVTLVLSSSTAAPRRSLRFLLLVAYNT